MKKVIALTLAVGILFVTGCGGHSSSEYQVLNTVCSGSPPFTFTSIDEGGYGSTTGYAYQCEANGIVQYVDEDDE